MRLVLIGGYPKGFDEPFHPKTASGRILRKIIGELKLNPVYFDLWNSKSEEDTRKISSKTKKDILNFERDGHTLVSLGRYIEKALADKGIKSRYLPHPASRDKKYVDMLKVGLKSMDQ